MNSPAAAAAAITFARRLVCRCHSHPSGTSSSSQRLRTTLGGFLTARCSVTCLPVNHAFVRSSLCTFLPLPTTQQRHFSSRKKKRSDKTTTADPFEVLGIPRDAPYAEAKSTFIEIAMSHHPDTSAADTEEERNRYRKIFIDARKAFEALAEGPEGSIILKKQQEEMKDFDEWFRNETGHDTPFQFMDAQTMKEVAEMEDTVGHGLDRDGGMWMLASMVSNAVKNKGDTKSILQLEAGDIQAQQGRNDAIDGVLRRKRRTRR